MIDEREEIFKQKADYYDLVIESFFEYRSAIIKTGSNKLKWIADFALFTLMGSYDLWIMICDFEKASKKYQQNLYARQMALTCFELLSDISQYFNKEFSDLMLEKIGNESIKRKAENIRKLFNKERNDKESYFKEIRNYTIAHRDHDIENQILIINNMDNSAIVKYSLEFLKKIEMAHEVLMDVISYLSREQNVNGNEYFKEKYK